MSRPSASGWMWLGVAGLLFMALASSAQGGLGDKLKKKAQEAAAKKAAEELEKKAVDVVTETEEPSISSGDATDPEEPVSAVSTKFDYMPGDKVILYDDFTQDELGEFPANWRLSSGTFEVAEKDGERWLRCVSADSHIRMKLPPMETLPEYWTLEFDFYCTEPMGSALTVSGLGAGEREVWRATYPVGRDMAFATGSTTSSTTLEGAEIGGRHHVMFMARGPALKAYIDRQRLASIPEISSTAGAPTMIDLRLWSSNKPMITNVRFAEGSKPTKDPFADGKLVTYGIYFDSGSDIVRAESAPVLRQIAAYLQANAAVRVQIVGHTDSQGKADYNLDLSKRRAAAVAQVLADEFEIAMERFESDGMGDTSPLADNEKAEGRAMNRRVELTKRQG